LFHKLCNRSLLSLVFTALSILLLLPHSIFAQSEEEKSDLLMFYEGKDLVVTSTRNAKSISHAAENITVVTAEEIERMNAHTVAEVLNRLPSMYISFFGRDFVSSSLTKTFGTNEAHTKVLLDGVPWNYVAAGRAETYGIPVGIIDRIEIVKGPASSSWGSSLAGVINIITKKGNIEKKIGGTVGGSYGKANSIDLKGEINGAVNKTDYYLYSGHKKSDGLDYNRYAEDGSVYGNTYFKMNDSFKVGVSAGSFDSKINLGDETFYAEFYKDYINYNQPDKIRSGFVTLSGEYHFTHDLKLNITANYLNKVNRSYYNEEYQDLYSYKYKGVFEDNKYYVNTKLVWDVGFNSVVFGADYENDSLDRKISDKLYDEGYYEDSTSDGDTSFTKSAAFINDTIIMGNVSVTPGLRMDYNRHTDSFLSPSLGVTYKLKHNTLFRAFTARGFNEPVSGWVDMNGAWGFTIANPDLKSEEVWTYQLGFETAAFKYVWFKTTLFYNDITNLFKNISEDGYRMYVNDGSEVRKGIELEFKTTPVYHVSLYTGFSYIKSEAKNKVGNEKTEICKIVGGVEYNLQKSLYLQLFSDFVDYNYDENRDPQKYNPIWDLNIIKTFAIRKRYNTELYFTGHNLFNGSQYSDGYNVNPDRWFEIGARYKF